jgi:RimJ/RimL family protein N-acetyltransferase
MRLAPTVLENRFVRLEPMGETHKAGFRALCDAEPSVWTELYPISWAGEHFEPAWRKLMDDAAAGRMIGFAVLVGGRCGGITCFSGIDAANRAVQIGGTYYAPELRGGATNPAAKRLLLGEAFEQGARRVQLNVDAINARSRAAVRKLGAVQEGVLRQDRICWTGRIRDTVVFSILADEWPEVRARLDQRLAEFP